jgi:predicted nucleotidyltransferase component of viral defense system
VDTPRQCVEQFHLLFLDQLGRRVDKKLYALKGGCNLRFFFRSLRYSEDMDLDVGASLEREVLRDKVESILGSRPFGEILRARGLEIVRHSAPKQTDTTQRWKLTLSAAADEAPMPTKVEFSRRGMGDEVRFEAVDPAIIGAYRLNPIMANHYAAETACRQKIGALLSRREPQARDVFDLSLLLKSGVDRLRLREEIRDRAEGVQERAMSVGFGVFRSQVLAFLPPEHQPQYDSAEVWDRMVMDIVEALESGRGGG